MLTGSATSRASSSALGRSPTTARWRWRGGELLNDTLTNTDAIIQVDDNQTLTLSGTEIIGGTINGCTAMRGGTIDVTGATARSIAEPR